MRGSDRTGRETFRKQAAAAGFSPELSLAAERMVQLLPKESRDETRAPLLYWLALGVFLSAQSGALRTRHEDVCRLLAASVEATEGGSAAGEGVLPFAEMEGAEALWALFLQGEEPLLRQKEGWLYLPRLLSEEERLLRAVEVRLDDTPRDQGVSPLPEAAFWEALREQESYPLDETRRLAVERALSSNWLIVTGGPGTGKTTVVMTILRGLLTAFGGNLRIFLAAPTGRAANRMTESLLSQTKEQNPVDSLIPREAFTLHRLLGRRPGSFRPPRYCPENPLPADVVVVDEASMVDIRMMITLLEGLSPETRLILVGDKDQLPSVEAGSILGDFLLGWENPSHRFHERVVALQKSWRSTLGILQAAQGVIRGDVAAVKEAFARGDQELRWLPELSQESRRKLLPPGEWKEPPRSEEEALRRAESRVVLSSLRRGYWGVEGLNRLMADWLRPRGEKALFSGMPLIITRNDPGMGLFNGDRGVLFKKGGRFFGLFRGGPEAPHRLIPLGLLPAWEAAYAQTIHKSQGSEFDEALVVLPEGGDTLLGREILYTGITRAKKRVLLVAGEERLSQAVKERVYRPSGIPQALHQD